MFDLAGLVENHLVGDDEIHRLGAQSMGARSTKPVDSPPHVELDDVGITAVGRATGRLRVYECALRRWRRLLRGFKAVVDCVRSRTALVVASFLRAIVATRAREALI